MPDTAKHIATERVFDGVKAATEKVTDEIKASLRHIDAKLDRLLEKD